MSNLFAGRDDDGTMLLTTASNKIELVLIQGLLEDSEIPYIIKDKGAGDYMRIAAGFSIYGTDVRVSATDYERAKELIDAYMSAENVENTEA